MADITIDPNTPEDNSHDFALVGKRYTVGLKLNGSLRQAVDEIPVTTQNVNVTAGGTKFGGWDAYFSEMEVSDWLAGGYLKEYDISRSGYRWTKDMWTMQAGRAYPSLMHQFGTGIRTVHSKEADNKRWAGLFGANRYMAEIITIGAADLAADTLNVYLRKVGSPGDVYGQVWTVSGGLPNALVASATASYAASDVKLPITQFLSFDLSAAADLTTATDYALVIFANSTTDNQSSHWEIGIDQAVLTAKISSAGSSWTAATWGMLYRLTDTDIEREWHLFEYRGLTHMIDHRDDGLTSVMMVNGWRGIPTSTQAIGTTGLTDTAQAWTVNELAGLEAKVIDGLGAGQHSEIVSNTSDTLVLSSSWKIALDTTSEFIIYGGAKWVDSGETLGGPAVDVLAANNIIYVCYGDLAGDHAIERMQWASGVPGYQIASDGTNKASFMEFHVDKVNGPEIWVVQDSGNHIHASAVKAWGTNLILTDVGDVVVGTKDYPFVDLKSLGSKLYAMKENHPFLYDATTAQAIPDVKKMSFMPNHNNGKEAIIHDIYEIFPYGEYYIAQRSDGVFQDISPAQKGEGPEKTELGAPSGLISHPGGIIAGFDAGHDGRSGGCSTVGVLEDSLQGWHTIFSAYDKNKRIRNIHWQVNQSQNPKLWISINGEMMYMKWPKGYRPLKDSTVKYQHECAMITAVINFNSYGVDKFLEEISLNTLNISSGVEAEIFYRVDENIEKDIDNWIPVGTIGKSPKQGLVLGLGENTEIQFLIVLRTSVATTPPIMNAFVVKGFSRVPVRANLRLSVISDSEDVDYLGNEDDDPEDVRKILNDFANRTEVVQMFSRVSSYNNIRVVVQPFNAKYDYVDEEDSAAEFIFNVWLLREPIGVEELVDA